MKPQRFWAVTENGEVYAHSLYETRAAAKESAQCDAGIRNCPECQRRVVRVEVRIVTPKPRKKRRSKP